MAKLDNIQNLYHNYIDNREQIVDTLKGKKNPDTKYFFYGKRDYIKMADNEMKKINYKLKNRNKLITK